MLQSFYTVAMDKKGFPVYYLCPNCLQLHRFPEEPSEATFNDPGEASSSFKATFSILADWILRQPHELVLLALMVGTQ